MIQRLEKISAQLFKNALKTYHLKDLLTHKRTANISLTEILSLYPNKGVGFHIFKNNWTPGLHYQVRRAEFKSYKHGHFYGIKVAKMPNSDKLKPMDDHPTRLQGLSKRGVWTYSLGDFESFKTDNGVQYTRADYEAYFKLRHVGISRKPAESAETQADQPQQTEQLQQTEQPQQAEQTSK